MGVHAPIDVIRDHYQAPARRDLDGMLARLASDAVWVEMEGSPYSGTFRGPDEVREKVFGPLRTDWDDFRFEFDELVDGGDVVVALGRYRGTSRATGRSLDARVAHAWRVRDGAVVGFEEFADTRLLAEAVGRA